MAKGVDAVKTEIERDFRPQKIDVHDGSSLGTVLKFSAEGRDFSVDVEWEFDEDYPNTQVRVDLKRLGPVLRASKTGKARVSRIGVIPA
jgi:hypothetical protein